MLNETFSESFKHRVFHFSSKALKILPPMHLPWWYVLVMLSPPGWCSRKEYVPSQHCPDFQHEHWPHCSILSPSIFYGWGCPKSLWSSPGYSRMTSLVTLFENHPICLIFQFWRFSPIFVLLKLSCLVTMFDRKLLIFFWAFWLLASLAMLNETFSVIFKHCDLVRVQCKIPYHWKRLSSHKRKIPSKSYDPCF